MITAFVAMGDLTRFIEVDAIATLINPYGRWYGGVDHAIRRVAGQRYHAQAEAFLASEPLFDGQVVIAGGDKTKHEGTFDNVIFVVDNLQSPLSELVYAALDAARQVGYRSVAFPLMRTGQALGLVEPDISSVVHEMKTAIGLFVSDGDVEMTIYIVVYGEAKAVELLSRSYKRLDK